MSADDHELIRACAESAVEERQLTYVEDGGLCDLHFEQDREKRKTETVEDRWRLRREGEERAARSHDRLRQEMEQERADRDRMGSR